MKYNGAEKTILLNQTAFFIPPFLAPILAFSCVNRLQYQLRAYIPELVIKIEGRVLVPKTNSLKNCLLNVLKAKTFPLAVIDFARRQGMTIDSFDIPDAIPFIESPRVSRTVLGNLLLKFTNAIWKYVSVENVNDVFRSMDSVLIRIKNLGLEKVYFHTSSKEMRKFLVEKDDIICFWLKNLGMKTLYIGIEIDHSTDTSESWIKLVKELKIKYLSLKNLEIGLDFDLFHIHESFIRNKLYKSDPNFDISTWRNFFTSVKNAGISIIDIHLHDGKPDGGIHALSGDLGNHWEEIAKLMNEFKFIPEHINLEFTPQVLLKTLIFSSNTRLLAEQIRLFLQ